MIQGGADVQKTKIIQDVKTRESDRVKREKEILKELSGEANKATMKSNEGVLKHLKKFVRKMLMLTVQD